MAACTWASNLVLTGDRDLYGMAGVLLDDCEEYPVANQTGLFWSMWRCLWRDWISWRLELETGVWQPSRISISAVIGRRGASGTIRTVVSDNSVSHIRLVVKHADSERP
jgi:hypothetical protein